MHVNVPQFIDIEDKIAFGLTGKQLLWMFGMGAVLVVMYAAFDRQTFFVIGLLVMLIFGSFAFWKPQGLPMIAFLGFVVQFLTKPRNYVWKRVHSASAVDFKKAALFQRKNSDLMAKTNPLPSTSQLRKIAWMLDTKK